MAGETLNFFGSDEYLGKVLVQKGVISQGQLEDTLRVQETYFKSGSAAPGLGQILLQKGFIQKAEVLETIARQVKGEAKCERCASPYDLSDPRTASLTNCTRCGGRLRSIAMPISTFGAEPVGLLDRPRTPPPDDVAWAMRDPKNLFYKYWLVGLLGEGGQGTVYKAWDNWLCQYVALKFIRTQDKPSTETQTTEQEVDEFIHDARMAARVRHPNIVSVHELGVHDNRFYISMELLPKTLLAHIHGEWKRMPVTCFDRDPVGYLESVSLIARAVHHAHSQPTPIVHRDLKPHNVLLDAAGSPKVVDFGLAKEIHLGGGDAESRSIRGTPPYMAPEQAAGDEVDPRTDVYGAGAILYEVLSGEPPFTGPDIRSILGSVIHKPLEPPSRRGARLSSKDPAGAPPRPRINRRLDEICLKALAKKKEDRYQTLREFADDLNRIIPAIDIQHEKSTVRRTIKRVRAHPVVSAVLAAAVLAAAVAGIVFWALPKGEDPVAAALHRGAGFVKSRNEPGLRTALEELNRIAPGHPQGKEWGAVLGAWEKEREAVLKEWKEILDRLKDDSKALDGLRALFKAHPDLREKFLVGLKSEVLGNQSACLGDSLALLGDGKPRPDWVGEEAKKKARGLKGRIEGLQALAKDPDFPQELDPRLRESAEGLDRIAAYLGTWSVGVNVVPYAEAVLFRGDREAAADLTPVLWRDLEVAAEGYRLELHYPSRKDSRKKVSKDLPGLRHGVRVTVGGDMAAGTIWTDLPSK